MQNFDPGAPERSQERKPPKSLSGIIKQLLSPTRCGPGQCWILHYCGVASGCPEENPTECQGASKSPCPCQVPAMEVPGSAVPFCGDRRLPPRRVTAPRPALCALPSPGRFLSCSPDARCVPAARGTPSTDLRPRNEQPTEGWRQARRRARVSAGLPRPVTPDRGLALRRAASGSGGLPHCHSFHGPRKRKPELGWLPAACLAAPAAVSPQPRTAA